MLCELSRQSWLICKQLDNNDIRFTLLLDWPIRPKMKFTLRGGSLRQERGPPQAALTRLFIELREQSKFSAGPDGETQGVAATLFAMSNGTPFISSSAIPSSHLSASS
jgi:hypothetical protein